MRQLIDAGHGVIIMAIIFIIMMVFHAFRPTDEFIMRLADMVFASLCVLLQIKKETP